MNTLDNYVSVKSRLHNDITNTYFEHYHWLDILPIDEATLMAYFIDAEDFVPKKLDGGWFECTLSFIQRRMPGLSKQNFMTLSNKLIERKLIDRKVVRVAHSNCNFWKINYNELLLLKQSYYDKLSSNTESITKSEA